MNDKQIELLLRTHDIRVTANRILIARTLSGMDNPTSIKELGAKLQTIDKSSIFRTLMLFKQQHLVHQIEDGRDVMRYELCMSHHENEDDDMHVHFFCEHCQQTVCLHEIPVPQVELPEGYAQSSVNYMVKGICPRCSKRYYHR
nr:transcriptional repressor [uncultured Prevotella sp.]